MNQAVNWYTLTLGAFFTIAVLGSYAGEGEKETAIQTETTQNNAIPQVIEPVDLDKPFDFAGESLPMESFDVRERLDNELTLNTYRHGNTLLNIKKSYRYFPIIERILREHDLPEDLKYIAVAESDLSNATSPAGAKGFWQFMTSTGQYYGLEINKQVDERYHLEKATVAACKYLKDYYKRFGSWSLAAAAYNMGGTRMSRELKAQNATTFYDLNLNHETMRYLFRLVAMKEIMSDPRKFGFYIEAEDGYPELSDYREVEINTAIENLGTFADEHDVSYRDIKVYNPWLISSGLTNSARKTYLIRIPNKKF
ncbi:lytic transglycosylase domain-containing protein [Flavilitoribacter nigricans]|uniref:Murein transglycosylase n=1 Tax=Flavilitoribacter nigricans (strain ATCC 23147 / DSM 23189 / NBRC 102662 / NCIMB 1420 / SS-2) TaxID=1122177 RepID=A0A2D0N7I1_FLAN2|nr:lytic transglycosylase domain-containing protein [Flavilitoribacter nigricans]PHN04471.1 murein transglycosylase [Flavilitoribacter nigricans DSM 23189 = NBRC 102662]